MKKLFLSILCFGLFGSIGAYADDDMANFDDGSEVKPLSKTLSEAEKSGDTDLDNIDYGQELPKIFCENENLKKQVANFVYAYVNREGANSVIEQRKQLLLVRNLHDFTDFDAKNLNSKDNYAAASIVAYLKINQAKEIYKICRSSGNNSKKFADLFAIIYRDGAYYKVVVPNLTISTRDIDKATFVYNW